MPIRPYPVLRVTVVSLDQGSNDVRPDAPAALLRNLGHEVTVIGYALLDAQARSAPPEVVVIEAGADLDVARQVITRLRGRDDLSNARFLLCVSVTRVTAMSLETAADDFIVMPICLPELAARLRQLVWREAAGATPADHLRFGPIVLDRSSMQASLDGRPLQLTPYEFQLLKFLIERPARVFPRDELLRRVWGYRAGRLRTVDTHVLNLRAKLGRVGALLEAVRGMGYKLKLPEDDPSDSAAAVP